LIGYTKKNFFEFKKSMLPAFNDRLREFKEKKEKRKGENTKKDKKDYTPPPIVMKEDFSDESKGESKNDFSFKRPVKKPTLPPEQFKLPEVSEGYKLPPLELLDPPEREQIKVDKDTLHANSLILQKKNSKTSASKAKSSRCALDRLSRCTSSSRRPASKSDVSSCSPTTSPWRCAPSAWRILAPIPGEAVVGIEIPNPRRETVYLRELIEGEALSQLRFEDHARARQRQSAARPSRPTWAGCRTCSLPEPLAPASRCRSTR
jgi:hypothetical protein